MKLTIEIDISNTDFDGDIERAKEVRFILDALMNSNLVYILRSSKDSHPIRNSNGNTVGFVRVTDE